MPYVVISVELGFSALDIIHHTEIRLKKLAEFSAAGKYLGIVPMIEGSNVTSATGTLLAVIPG